MSKVLVTGNSVWFYCPGCKTNHRIVTDKWTWNGDKDKPTFSPSILVTGYIGENQPVRCHSFVKEGKIQYLGDCEHHLKDKTIDMEDF